VTKNSKKQPYAIKVFVSLCWLCGGHENIAGKRHLQQPPGLPFRIWHVVQDGEMSESLRGEFEEFYKFCLKRSWQQQHEPITKVTADKYADHLRYTHDLVKVFKELNTVQSHTQRFLCYGLKVAMPEVFNHRL
jgi:hypothetical protein